MGSFFARRARVLDGPSRTWSLSCPPRWRAVQATEPTFSSSGCVHRTGEDTNSKRDPTRRNDSAYAGKRPPPCTHNYQIVCRVKVAVFTGFIVSGGLSPRSYYYWYLVTIRVATTVHEQKRTVRPEPFESRTAIDEKLRLLRGGGGLLYFLILTRSWFCRAPFRSLSPFTVFDCRTKTHVNKL